MKNRYIKVIILIVFAIILVIIADRNKANEIFEETQSNQIAEKEAKWQIPEIDSSEDGFTVSAKVLFEDGNGYGWYLCNQTGTYQFQISGENKDIYSKDLSDIVWKVYLMDKPFADAPRFIPQAGYEAVIVGNGEIEITKGTYVVVYCSQNAYEYGLNYAGDDNAGYKCSLKIR